MQKQITTVQGRVPYKKLGITDAHNHLWISGQDVKAENAPILDQQEKIIQELVSYRQLGGNAQLDCQPGGAGRDGVKLLQISKGSGVQIIACTGFHLREYYPEQSTIWQLDTEQAAEYILSEIKEGLEETRQAIPVFPGFIKIAVRETLEKSPQHLMAAAFVASATSGLLIEMHTEKGAAIEDFVDYFENKGLKPGSLVICHIDKRPDLGLHKELARAGYLLEYDTFFRPKYEPEKFLWPLILDLVNSGFSKSLALATDLADSSMWQSMGNGPGLSGFIDLIKKRLDEEIQDPKVVKDLVGGNIAERLAI